MRCRFLVGKGGRITCQGPKLSLRRELEATLGSGSARSVVLHDQAEGFLGFAGTADSSLRRVQIIPFCSRLQSFWTAAKCLRSTVSTT